MLSPFQLAFPRPVNVIGEATPHLLQDAISAGYSNVSHDSLLVRLRDLAGDVPFVTNYSSFMTALTRYMPENADLPIMVALDIPYLPAPYVNIIVDDGSVSAKKLIAHNSYRSNVFIFKEEHVSHDRGQVQPIQGDLVRAEGV